jgi:hypothetical protein
LKARESRRAKRSKPRRAILTIFERNLALGSIRVLAALDKLARALGMYTDKVDVITMGRDSGDRADAGPNGRVARRAQ